MDSLANAAARALANGDALGALAHVALRNDPTALALRGIAMAQLDELVDLDAVERLLASPAFVVDACRRRVSGCASTPRRAPFLKTIDSDRFVTGVSWVDDELWHGTCEGDESELRHVDAVQRFRGR